jgi:YD repeat-containing protein
MTTKEQFGVRNSRLAAALTLVVAMCWCSGAEAQTGSVAAENGFQPNRDYLALQSWEAIDTASGNLILTFTDLALPGNAGQELRFQRIFNNVPGGASAAWTFGIAGIPLRIFQPNIPAGTVIPSDIEGEQLYTPTLLMADGSQVRTTFMSNPAATNPDLQWVWTPTFWKYHRGGRTLYIPDGRVANYLADGRVSSVFDAFGNWISFGYPASDRMTVTQWLSATESRLVTVYFEGSPSVPSRIEYDGRNWYYDHHPNWPGRLVQVRPPDGPNWTFEYEEPANAYSRLRRVVTPQGGQVTYDYDWVEFVIQYSPTYESEWVYTLLSRTANDGSTSGTWAFRYQQAVPNGVMGLIVTLPTDVVIEHQYSSLGPNMLIGAWFLGKRLVYATDGGALLEEYGEDYTALPAARPGRGYAGVIVSRGISRGAPFLSPPAYETRYFYEGGATTYNNYNRPSRIEERQGSTLRRTTYLSYDHRDGLSPYWLGLPATEQVQVGSQLSSRSWSHDARGFLQSETLNGVTTSYTRTEESRGNVVTATNANGHTMTFSYMWGQVSSTTMGGETTSRQMYPDGSVQSETVAGRTTTFIYDRLGREIFRQPPGSAAIQTDYAATEVVTTRSGSGGTSTLVTSLDGFGRAVGTRNGENSARINTATTLDSQGRTEFERLPFRDGDPIAGVKYCYDELGRVVAEILVPAGNSCTLSSNPAGSYRRRIYDDLADTIQMVDENGRQTLLKRRGFGHPDDAQLVAVVDPAGKEWAYTYDVFGNLRTVSGPAGAESVTRTWTYDTQNRLTSETHPESGTVQYSGYDAAGQLTGKTDANATTFTYAYDDRERLKTVTGGGLQATFTYEPGTDQRTLVETAGVTTSYAYDAGGRLSERRDQVDGKSFTVRYAYDLRDNLTELTYPSGRSVRYAYDSLNRITRVWNDVGDATYAGDFTYHPSGGVKTFTAGNGLVTTIDYDNRFRVTGIGVGSLLGLGYQYDAVGNVTKLLDARGGRELDLVYDVLDRLDSFQPAPGSSMPSADYAYDSHGNIGAMGLVYRSDNRFRLASIQGASVTYDNNGNMVAGPGSTYAFGQGNRMLSATVSGTTTTFTYDADDWRVKKTTNGKTTYATRGPNGQLLSEWEIDGATTTIRDYIYASSRLIAVVKATSPAN